MVSDDIGEPEYFWCLRHQRIESGDGLCPVRNRLGPYRTRAEAEAALETVRRRNEQWDEEDTRWDGESEG